MTLDFNNKEFLDSEKFEYLVADLFSGIHKTNYYKRGIKRQEQSGFDVISNDGYHKIECKQYATRLTVGMIKNFITKFETEADLAKTHKFTICISQEIENKDIFDLIVEKNEAYKSKGQNLQFEIFDRKRISNKIFDKKLFGLVLRYFNEDIFKAFFGTVSEEYLDNSVSFNHVKNELKESKNMPFLKEVTANIIRENKVYKNQKLVDKIQSLLNEKKCCILSAPEGRGKTIISRIMGYESYYNNGLEVFFLDLRYENNLSKIKNQIYKWSNLNANYLLILENAHSFQNSFELFDEINKFLESSDNINFLINTRYIVNHELSTRLEQSCLELQPSLNDAHEIINLYNQNSDKQVDPNEIEEFVATRISDDAQKTINLRLLNLILDTWKNNPGLDRLLDVDEKTICRRFLNKFDLSRKSESVLDEIEYFACIHSFDIPFTFDKEKHNSRLEKLHQFITDGLATNNNKGISLFHSYDAIYLFKAICLFRNNKTEDRRRHWITKYLYEIIDNPEIFMMDSLSTIMITVSLKTSSDQEYLSLCQHLFEEIPHDKLLIPLIRLSPSVFFTYSSYHFHQKNTEHINSLLKNEEELIMNSIKSSKPMYVVSIENFFFKYLKIDLCSILFSNTEEFKTWVDNLEIGSGMVAKTLRRASQLSSEHAQIVEGYRAKRIARAPKLISHISTPEIPNAIIIHKKFVNSLYFEGGKPGRSNKYKFGLILQKSFYLQDLTWKYLGKFLNAIAITFPDDPDSSNNIFNYIWNKSKSSIMSKEVLEKAKPAALSRFLKNLETLSPEAYEEFKRNPHTQFLIADILDSFEFDNAHLYLIGHFLDTEDVSDLIKSKLTSGTSEDCGSMKEFYDAIAPKLEIITKGSLIDLIEEILTARGMLDS